jgi:hypothetical protein
MGVRRVAMKLQEGLSMNRVEIAGWNETSRVLLFLRAAL